ncbi:MAG: hypothetical protein AABZ60_04540 [Planctomycetota bacterium]
MLLQASSYAISHKLQTLFLRCSCLFFCFFLEDSLPKREERFVEKLLSKNIVVSGIAITQLKKLPNEKQKELTSFLLRDLLQEENLWRRERASLMFLYIQPKDKELVLKIVPLLQDQSISVRGYITKILGNMGSTAIEAILPLKTLLLAEENYFVRENVLEALLQIQKQ